MIIINVGKRESIDSALKRYKYKVFMTKLHDEVRNRQYYTKKSEQNRKQKLQAIYTEKKRKEEDN